MIDAKAALFDLISDTRNKLDCSDNDIKREYDSLVKEMVLLGTSQKNQKRSLNSDLSDDESGEPRASIVLS